jgi:hypothetical protein
MESVSILVVGLIDDAPEPGSQVIVFLAADRAIAGRAVIAEAEDVRAEFQFGQGDLGGHFGGFLGE